MKDQVPHPDWLQRAIDRNPRTSKGRTGTASRAAVDQAIRECLAQSPHLDEVALLAAIRATPLLHGMKVTRELFRQLLRERRPAKRGRPNKSPN